MEAPKPVELTADQVKEYRGKIADRIRNSDYRGHFIVVFADRKSMFWTYLPGTKDLEPEPEMVITLVEQDSDDLDQWNERVIDATKIDQHGFAYTRDYAEEAKEEKHKEPVTLELLLGKEVMEEIHKRVEKETFFAELEHKDIGS